MDSSTIKEARSILSDKGSSREDMRDARDLLKMQKSVKSPKETISNLPLMPNDTSKIESLPLEEYKRAKGGRVASKPRGVGVALRGFGKALKGSK